jgi:hypothetical protein
MRGRPLDDIMEDLLGACEAAHEYARQPPPPPTAQGADRSGGLALTITATALWSCAADPAWVYRQNEAMLAAAFAQALAQARANLVEAAAVSGPADRVGRLADELIARLAETGVAAGRNHP